MHTSRSSGNHCVLQYSGCTLRGHQVTDKFIRMPYEQSGPNFVASILHDMLLRRTADLLFPCSKPLSIESNHYALSQADFLPWHNVCQEFFLIRFSDAVISVNSDSQKAEV